jgi:hypothetical protein
MNPALRSFRMRFNGKLAFLVVAILANLILASAISKDSSAVLSLILALLAGAAGIFIFNSRKNFMLPSGRISVREVRVLPIRRSPCLS